MRRHPPACQYAKEQIEQAEDDGQSQRRSDDAVRDSTIAFRKCARFISALCAALT
jgi:hypothetical protein